VAPRSPGNVGATARAIANHGLGRLVLVAPPHFDPDRARWMAPRAHAHIDRALIVGTVHEAIERLDVERVIGTTARKRRLVTPVWGPHELAEVVHTSPCSTAIVFGPEDFGLDNDSVARCDAVLRLPTTTHSSLNLAQAVNITAASLRLLGASAPARELEPPAPAPLRAQVTDDLIEVLRETTYFSGQSEVAIRARITSALGRLPLDHHTLASARGFLKSIRHRIRTRPQVDGDVLSVDTVHPTSRKSP